MSTNHLATYLSDHLAGSAAILELLEHMEKTHQEPELRTFFGGLRADIGAEREQLESLVKRLAIPVGILRASLGWFAEKVIRLKLSVDDSPSGSLRLLEATELVATGIEGKRSLWLALDAVSAKLPKLKGPDYKALVARSVEQRERIEPVRIAAASAAFQETKAN